MAMPEAAVNEANGAMATKDRGELPLESVGPEESRSVC